MKVEVFTTTTLEVSHFGPIVRALCELGVHARFCSPEKSPTTHRMGWDDSRRIDELLEREKLPFSKTPDYDADAVLTIQSAEFVSMYGGLKMRMTYGVGLIPPTQHNPLSQPFDYHFVHGPFNQRVQFSQHALPSPDLSADRVKVIGYPRFDGWWTRGWGGPAGHRGNPVLLWLPTWGRASSIDRYADAIFALSDRYDIWVKPHHGTVTWERERMIKLAEGPCRIVEFTDPPEPSFAAASIVLADLASGAFSEAVFLNKRTIGLSSREEVEKILLPDAEYATAFCTSPKMLTDWSIAIELALLENAQPAKAECARRDLFDSTEGADGMRAAKIIVECVDAR